MAATAKERLNELLTALPDSVPHIHESAWIDPASVPFTEEVRKMCEANRCGMYGKCWTCPPGVGHWEDLRDRYRAYKEAYVFTTCHALEDSFDFEGMQHGMKDFKKMLDKLNANLKNALPEYLLLGNEGCGRCRQCTYPDQPCRFPELLYHSIEGYGFIVSELAKSAGVRYTNGANTVTFFGAVLWNPGA